MFIPLESLTTSVVKSIVSVATTFRRSSFDYSERTLLAFLLQIENKLRQSEATQYIDIRQCLSTVNWKELQLKYQRIENLNCDEMARYFKSSTAQPYFELICPTNYAGVLQSREYMNKSRPNGFHPNELKLYWNYEQIENLCPEKSIRIECDPSDEDARLNLCQFPVQQRNHRGQITFIHDAIQQAVFRLPSNAQIILLNFANEQSPGGGYLRHARAQEEVLLYNSDGYRALLDLKYQRMNGGYALPEFGLAYIRNIRIYQSLTNQQQFRNVDMLVCACYCLNGRELYSNPVNKNDLKRKTLKKFRALIGAAVANTIGNGENTYLLLGPIGTGAFGNDVEIIGQLFYQVLHSPLMGANQSIKYAFQHIHFVSTDKYKNELFKRIFSAQSTN